MRLNIEIVFIYFKKEVITKHICVSVIEWTPDTLPSDDELIIIVIICRSHVT